VIAWTLAAALLLLAAGPALAHPAPLGLSGFSGGLLHPLFVPAHLLAVAALGLLIGAQAPRPRRVAMAIYVIAVLAGLGAIALAYAPTQAEPVLLICAALSGLLAALNLPLPRALGWPLAAATGAALGLDSPPDAVSLAAANRALLGAALGAAVLLVVIAEVSALPRHDWARIGLRIAGSWIAASAILVLALRLAR
jgi:urease accessory protein